MIGQMFNYFAAACSAHNFFGLEPWYKYLTLATKQDASGNAYCDVTSFHILPASGQSSDVPLILVAIIDDLLRIAGIIAVGFVLYGAFLYTSSQGNPEQTAKAQSTVINALIGMALATIAVAIVGFLGNKLGG